MTADQLATFRVQDRADQLEELYDAITEHAFQAYARDREQLPPHPQPNNQGRAA